MYLVTPVGVPNPRLDTTAVYDVAFVYFIFRMEELGIDNDGGSVCFGQLLGMCDHVSLTLGELWHSLHLYFCVLFHYSLICTSLLEELNLQAFSSNLNCYDMI